MSLIKPLWFGRHKALVGLIRNAEQENNDTVLLDRKWLARLADEFGECLIRTEQLERLARDLYPAINPEAAHEEAITELSALLYPESDLGDENDPLALRNQYREG